MAKYPLEKILACTPTEYCASVGEQLKNYRLIGVNVVDDRSRNILESFRKEIPPEADVVVNYSQDIMAVSGGLFGMNGISQSARGTAMIPKK